MGIRTRATGIATIVWLAVLLSPSARADEFNFTFSGNQAVCSQLGITNCSDFGSGTFTTGPLTVDTGHPGTYPITSMTGTMDGFTISFLQSSGAIDANGIPIKLQQICCSGPVIFLANSQQWAIVRWDLPIAGWNDFLVNNPLSMTGSSEPINLTITAPEPSTLLFLSIGLLGVMGLTLLKNRLS